MRIEIQPLPLVSILMFAIFVVICCQDSQVRTLRDESSMSGAELAIIYCDSCHAYVPPGQLDKSTWSKVLSRMGYFMGFREEGVNPLDGLPLEEALRLEVGNVYPQSPIMSDSSWLKIQSFILREAPDTLILPRTSAPPITTLFDPALEETSLGGFPMVCLIDYDEDYQRLYLGDINGMVQELNGDLEVTNFTKMPNPIVKTIRDKESDELYMLDIGFIDSKDLQYGAIGTTDLATFSHRTLLFEELPRPVDMAISDLNGDRQEDIVVCGFGNQVGKLSWFRKSQSAYVEHILIRKPGAIKLDVLDLDGNNTQDILVLFGQGDESLVAFLNDGMGNFEQKLILRFNALHGSSDYDLVDMDRDGDLDLVMTNGDNGDFSQVLKPHHGVRIYINRGDFSFEESYFYSMYGAYQCVVQDFDEDGDQDIFVSSFYPDFTSDLSQSLIFLENSGDLSFEPHRLKNAHAGRWMVLDAGDIDQDGDQDIMIGAYTLGPGNVPEDVRRKWFESETHVMILYNQTR